MELFKAVPGANNMPAEMLARWREDRHRTILAQRRAFCGLPSRFLTGTAGTPGDSAGSQAVAKWCDDYFDDDAAEMEERNLYIWGPIGSGKTWLAQWAIARCLERERCKFTTRVGLIADVQSSYSSDETTEADVLEHWSSVPRLAIDDLDKGQASPSVRKILWAVVDSRLRMGLPTIYTANVRPQDLARVLGSSAEDVTAEAIADRLRVGRVVEMKGKSRRQ